MRCEWRMFDEAFFGLLESTQGAHEVDLCEVAEGCESFMNS